MKTQVPSVWTALVTPFESTGKIDLKSFDKLLEEQLAAEITGIVISGTTGEAPALEVSEKIALVERAKKFSKNKLQIMVGTGSNNTNDSVELSKKARDAGADSLLVVTPPYNKPTLAGLVKHFEAISEGSKTPICLYHVPGRTAQHLSAEAMKKITEVDRVFSIKEASGDLALYSRVLEACPNKIILTGDDPTYLPSLSVGGQGVISVLTNAFPKAFVSLSRAYATGDNEKAKKIHHLFFPLIESLFCETNPTPVKYVMEKIGLCSSHVRLPLAPLTRESVKHIDKTLETLTAKLFEVSL